MRKLKGKKCCQTKTIYSGLQFKLRRADLAVHSHRAHHPADAVYTVMTSADDILSDIEIHICLNEDGTSETTHFDTLEDAPGVCCTDASNTLCNCSCSFGISDIKIIILTEMISIIGFKSNLPTIEPLQAHPSPLSQWPSGDNSDSGLGCMERQIKPSPNLHQITVLEARSAPSFSTALW